MPVARVVVVGGGVIGCAIARELAGRDVAVTVLERGTPGREASWAAAGMLAPLAEADRPGPFLDLLIEARERFDALPAALHREVGIDVEFRSGGTLALALDDERAADLRRRVEWQRAGEHPPREIGRAELGELEPALDPEGMRCAVHFPRDDQVDARRFTRALSASAMGRGARVTAGAHVRAVTSENGVATGVALDDGERVAADAVVIAAGAWGGAIEGIPRPVPVRPVHGEMASIELFPDAMTRVVNTGRVYAVPRADGRVVLGATEGDRGFEKVNTPAGLERILGGAALLGPAFARAPVRAIWSGLRPMAPDRLPILGPDPGLEGLYHATAHHRNGILLAPLTAELIADAVLGRPNDARLAPYRIDRFDG